MQFYNWIWNKRLDSHRQSLRASLGCGRGAGGVGPVRTPVQVALVSCSWSDKQKLCLICSLIDPAAGLRWLWQALLRCPETKRVCRISHILCENSYLASASLHCSISQSFSPLLIPARQGATAQSFPRDGAALAVQGLYMPWPRGPPRLLPPCCTAWCTRLSTTPHRQSPQMPPVPLHATWHSEMEMFGVGWNYKKITNVILA